MAVQQEGGTATEEPQGASPEEMASLTGSCPLQT